MKRTLLNLLALMSCAFAASAAPDVTLFFKEVNVYFQNDLFFAQEKYKLQPSGMDVIDFTGMDLSCLNFYGFAALVGNSANIPTVNATGVTMYWRIYAEGSQPPAWESIDAPSRGVWWEYLGHKMNLLDGLTAGQTYRFEFYIEGDYNGWNFRYDNGGANYKVRYTMPDLSKPRLLAAGIDLLKNDELLSYDMTTRNGRDPASDIGPVNSLKLNSSFFNIYWPENYFEIDEARMYVNSGSGWKYYTLPDRWNQHDNMIYFYTGEEDLQINLLNGIAEGNHTLKIYFAVTFGENGYIFGEDDPMFDFDYSYTKGSSGVFGDLNGDGKVDVGDLDMLIDVILGN